MVGLIERLQKYWREKGCLVIQPYDAPMGAGTFHPATFLRCLGDAPWRAVYVQPCRRPKDGRYGRNPNRLQHYYQLQVALKPVPEDFLPLYFGSLEAVGIRRAEHDLRLVEDDWESPTLGAAGLGWQAWLDGLEITQITYFQQAGGQELPVVTGELTYGIERLAMFLQDKDDVFDLVWSSTGPGVVTYRDLFHRNEVEGSIYGFERAEPADWKIAFEAAEREALALLKPAVADAAIGFSEERAKLGLPLPAYDAVIRASHAFNLLDARRALSVTERAGYIGRVRKLARRVAEAYSASVKGEAHLGFGHVPSVGAAAPLPEAAKPGEARYEIAVEDLPASWVASLVGQVRSSTEAALAAARLKGSVHAFGTCRRLGVRISDLPASVEAVEEERTGPAAKAAFGADGKPTQAALGFANKNGVAPEALYRVQTPKGEYVAAKVRVGGGRTEQLLPRIFHSVRDGLRFPKQMLWDASSGLFGRPFRRQAASFSGKQLDDAAFEELGAPPPHVILDPTEREKRVRELLAAAIPKAEGEVALYESADQDLVHRVAGSVEWPAAVVGSYDEKFLELPIEIVKTALREHQMAFACQTRPMRLLPKFAVIYDGDPSIADKIRRGHERVVHARLSDAKFFWDEDRKRPLVERVDDLKAVTWHAKLGSLYDKSERVRKLMRILGTKLGFRDKELDLGDRSARLYKVDQVSLLIAEKEFAGLQGIVGRCLALANEEPFDVAMAIDECYEPRGAGVPAAPSDFGALLAIADRLDSIVGLLAAGETVTGSEDPLGIRRDALGLLLTLKHHGYPHTHDPRHDHGSEHALWQFPIRWLLDEAAGVYPEAVLGISDRPRVVEKALEVIRTRLTALLLDDGHPQDALQAIVGVWSDSVPGALERARTLRTVRGTPEFEPVYRAFVRVLNLLSKEPHDAGEASVDAGLLATAEERALHAAVTSSEGALAADLAAVRIDAAYARLAGLAAPIDRFFETTLVMAEDKAVQDNRIRLLKRVRSALSGFCDFRAVSIPGAAEAARPKG